nr:MAG TPA: Helix-turn-helix XRE-family like protein [Caudoviricetes sp.]
MRLADEEIERDFRWTNDELAASRRRDADIFLSRKSKRDRSIAEKQRAYYEANKDSIAEKQRAYREANKDSIAEYQRAYYEANKDSIAEYQRDYYEANKDSIAEKQQWIRHKRLNRGYSQYELAEAIGCSQAMISRLESGDMKLETFFAKDALCAVLGARL